MDIGQGKRRGKKEGGKQVTVCKHVQGHGARVQGSHLRTIKTNGPMCSYDRADVTSHDLLGKL
eukprot:4315691-Prorocentrum_lima.AAC.1